LFFYDLPMQYQGIVGKSRQAKGKVAPQLGHDGASCKSSVGGSTGAPRTEKGNDFNPTSVRPELVEGHFLTFA
jgi:hypothetical protein